MLKEAVNFVFFLHSPPSLFHKKNQLKDSLCLQLIEILVAVIHFLQLLGLCQSFSVGVFNFLESWQWRKIPQKRRRRRATSILIVLRPNIVPTFFNMHIILLIGIHGVKRHLLKLVEEMCPSSCQHMPLVPCTGGGIF